MGDRYPLVTYQTSGGAPLPLVDPSPFASSSEEDEEAAPRGSSSSSMPKRYAPRRASRRERCEESWGECMDKAWVRRCVKWLLIGSCAALAAIVLFALISSLADEGTDEDGRPPTPPAWARWEVVCLGVGGGLDQSDLAGGFLLRPLSSSGPPAYISFDAGTSLYGIGKALGPAKSREAERSSSPSGAPALTYAGAIFRDSIKAYLLSHAHMDHVAGLVIGSPDDAFATPRKVVAGTNFTLDILQSHLFNWKVWPNMANRGASPIGLYNFTTLTPSNESRLAFLPTANISVRPFLLSHGKTGDGSTYYSTAFLVRTGEDYVLYFGDTGADQVEGSDYMKQVWMYVAPLVSQGKLRAIFLECSYGDDRSEDKLYGHLNPKLFMQEIGVLSELVAAINRGRGDGLKGLKVFVNHIKADDIIFYKQQTAFDTIKQQLVSRNHYGVDLHFPRQGDWIYL